MKVNHKAGEALKVLGALRNVLKEGSSSGKAKRVCFKVLQS